MEITWLGQSCFRIKSTHGVVITDPYSPDTGYIMGKQTARIVTVSHQHPDHNFTQGIGGEPRIVDRPGEYEISNTLIVGINTFHDNEQGKLRGRNVVYLIEMDEISVCHLGDLGHLLNSQQVEQLQHIDILMIPVGGITSLDGAMAAEVVRQLSPKVVIPMHYKTPALKTPGTRNSRPVFKGNGCHNHHYPAAEAQRNQIDHSGNDANIFLRISANNTNQRLADSYLLTTEYVPPGLHSILTLLLKEPGGKSSINVLA